MKKTLLSALFVTLFAGASFAQDEQSGGGFKATDGSITLEANVNPLAGTVNLSNSLNQIRTRMFISDDMALRLGFNLGLDNQASLSDDGEVETTERVFTLGIQPGIEKHFAGTDRLSPYVGAELGIMLDSRKTTVESTSSVSETEGFAQGGRGSFFFGANAVAGFDFYVARNLYIGYELGFGLGVRSESDVVEGSSISAGSSYFQVGPNVQNGIRVGFVF